MQRQAHHFFCLCSHSIIGAWLHACRHLCSGQLSETSTWLRAAADGNRTGCKQWTDSFSYRAHHSCCSVPFVPEHQKKGESEKFFNRIKTVMSAHQEGHRKRWLKSSCGRISPHEYTVQDSCDKVANTPFDSHSSTKTTTTTHLQRHRSSEKGSQCNIHLVTANRSSSGRMIRFRILSLS